MNNHEPVKTSKHSSSSWPQSMIRYAKNFVTWEGHDISQLRDDQFLRKGEWENNLKVLADASRSLSNTLTTKEFWQWLPKNFYIAEGRNSLKEQKEGLASAAYRRWLTIGLAAGLGYAFFKAMQFNFQCLGEFEDPDYRAHHNIFIWDPAVLPQAAFEHCNVRYGQALSQPVVLTKAAFGAIAWCVTGLWAHSLGDFGLKGSIKERLLLRNLITIYKETANSAHMAFWKAVDDHNETKARGIYDQIQAIKNSSGYHKTWTTLNLGLSPEDYDKMLRPFHILIEEVLKQDLNVLFRQPKG